MVSAMISEMDVYLFDLRGFIILRGALGVNEVEALRISARATARRW